MSKLRSDDKNIPPSRRRVSIGVKEPVAPPASVSGREMASVGVGACLFALSRGVSLDAIVEATELNSDQLLNPGAWVPQAVLLRIWSLLTKTLPGSAVALEMAGCWAPVLLGELGKVVRLCPDLGSMVRLVSRHAALLGDGIRIDVMEGPFETEFRMHHPSDEADQGYGAELGLGVAARFAETHFGSDIVRRVDFRHHALAPLAAYTQFFRAEVRFQQQHNALVTATAHLGRQNPLAEPTLSVLVNHWLDHLHKDRATQKRSDVAHSVRLALLANVHRGDYSATGLARSMGMSLRSLQRALRLEGLEAHALLDDMRRGYAFELVKDNNLTIETIAEWLGYSDERSFRRAFERWTGKSPAEARRQGFVGR